MIRRENYYAFVNEPELTPAEADEWYRLRRYLRQHVEARAGYYDATAEEWRAVVEAGSAITDDWSDIVALCGVTRKLQRAAVRWWRRLDKGRALW